MTTTSTDLHTPGPVDRPTKQPKPGKPIVRVTAPTAPKGGKR